MFVAIRRLSAAEGRDAFLSLLFFLPSLSLCYRVPFVFTTGFRLGSACLARFPVTMIVLLSLTSSALEIHILATGELQHSHLWIVLVRIWPPIKMLVCCSFVGLEKSLVPHFLSSLRIPHLFRGPCYGKHAWTLQTCLCSFVLSPNTGAPL